MLQPMSMREKRRTPVTALLTAEEVTRYRQHVAALGSTMSARARVLILRDIAESAEAPVLRETVGGSR